MDADKSLSSLPDNGHHGTHMAMIQDPRGASNNGGRVHSLKFNSPETRLKHRPYEGKPMGSEGWPFLRGDGRLTIPTTIAQG